MFVAPPTKVRVTAADMDNSAALLQMLRPSEKNHKECVKVCKAYLNLQRSPACSALFIASTAFFPETDLVSFLASARLPKVKHVISACFALANYIVTLRETGKIQ